MAANRSFECDNCGSIGKITLRGHDRSLSDIAFCPVCGADIFEPEEDDDDDDEDINCV